MNDEELQIESIRHGCRKSTTSPGGINTLTSNVGFNFKFNSVGEAVQREAFVAWLAEQARQSTEENQINYLKRTLNLMIIQRLPVKICFSFVNEFELNA